jgi:hypothetical protein
MTCSKAHSEEASEFSGALFWPKRRERVRTHSGLSEEAREPLEWEMGKRGTWDTSSVLLRTCHSCSVVHYSPFIPSLRGPVHMPVSLQTEGSKRSRAHLCSYRAHGRMDREPEAGGHHHMPWPASVSEDLLRPGSVLGPEDKEFTETQSPTLLKCLF